MRADRAVRPAHPLKVFAGFDGVLEVGLIEGGHGCSRLVAANLERLAWVCQVYNSLKCKTDGYEAAPAWPRQAHMAAEPGAFRGAARARRARGRAASRRARAPAGRPRPHGAGECDSGPKLRRPHPA